MCVCVSVLVLVSAIGAEDASVSCVLWFVLSPTLSKVSGAVAFHASRTHSALDTRALTIRTFVVCLTGCFTAGGLICVLLKAPQRLLYGDILL